MLPLYFLFTCASVAYAQFSIRPIPHVEHKQRVQKVNGAIHQNELEAIKLPFWDDFSFSNSTVYPHDTLWQFGESVWISNGMGINAPSLGVAVFDGLDSLGSPYSVNDILQKGIADRMVSAPLRLDLVPASERASVKLSFFYQYKGNGEPPDPGDQLHVLFKNDEGSWKTVHTVEYNELLDPRVFTPILISVVGASYFHEDFQFKIQSYGRLSGAYDTWIIDYVYLNSKRLDTDTSYPDRAINAPLSTLFNDYWSMPIHHFMENPADNLKRPFLSIHNLKFIPGNTTQEDHRAIRYSTMDSITIYRNQTKEVYTHVLDNNTFFGVIAPLAFSSKAIQTLPPLSNLSIVDSMATIKLTLWINANDNSVNPNEDPPGDYNIIKYAPIDFRYNDTTHITFTLSNYYAHDDGTAEYGATLNKSGAQLAYLFEMKTAKEDNIKALDFFFPSFGKQESPSIEIQILSSLDGRPESVLYSKAVAITQTRQNKFWRHMLNKAVIVKNKFYVGWKQKGNAPLTVGLDKNTDTGEKIFYNTNGSWQQDTNLSGSLMIRPVFGEGAQVITHIYDDKTIPDTILLSPNPNHGSFTLFRSDVQQVRLFDLMGKSIGVSTKKIAGETTVNIHHPQKGMYILHLLYDGGATTHRIMVD